MAVPDVARIAAVQERTGLAKSVFGVRNSKVKDMARISVPDVREAVKCKLELMTISFLKGISNSLRKNGSSEHASRVVRQMRNLKCSPFPAGLFLFAACILSSSNAAASDISLHGFLQGNYSADAASSNPDGADFKLAEERLQLKLDASKDPFRIFIKADGFYDHIDEKPKSELREGYLDFTSSKWDGRVGRQVITWGVGDLIFINDVFPKDYEAFFSGRPLEYLKKGIDGAKIGIYPGFASFEVIAIPFFTPNTFPSPNRFWMFDPMPGVTDREKVKPPVTLGNTEIALRAYRDIAGFDVSFYAYRGFFRQPSMMPDNATMPTKLTLFYPDAVGIRREPSGASAGWCPES